MDNWGVLKWAAVIWVCCLVKLGNRGRAHNRVHFSARIVWWGCCCKDGTVIIALLFICTPEEV